MIIINKLQKAVYECLKNQQTDNFNKLSGIFNYIDKNTIFPYIFLSIDETKDISTYTKQIYSCLVCINIFDKNTTNSFIMDTSEEIKEIFKNISNLSSNDFQVIDIKYKNFELSLETNNTIWNGKLSFEIIVISIIK